MFSQCANPVCGLAFDYRQGRLFRFHKNHDAGKPAPNTHSVQHFWLCGTCSQQFTLEYRQDAGVLIHRACAQAGTIEEYSLIASA